MAEVTHKETHFHDEEDAHHDHHVHFSEDVGMNTEIQVRTRGKTAADVHVGFLQHKHKYEIEFVLPEAPSSPLTCSTPSPFIFICNVKSLGDGKSQEVTLQLDAHKEGLLRNKFTITNDESKEEMTVVLHARVLGHKKGTPMLKDGIKCIGAEKDEEEEEHSDWQGFD